MIDEDLVAFLRGLDLTVETTQDTNGHPYTVIRQVTIAAGSLAGRTCDVALARCQSVPYLVAPAIHTRPAMVPMDTGDPLHTQPSPLGPDWQYWSRRFDHSPTPQRVWAHILTILGEV
jgi:hypothetical protein